MIRVNALFEQSSRLRAVLVGVALAASALFVQAQVFSAPKNLSNDGSAEFEQIAVDSRGNINVVWDDFTPGNFDIFFSRSTDGGATFSTPKNVSKNAGSSVFPQIAVDSNGNINVVWGDNTPGNSDIFFSRSSDGGATFSAPKNLSNIAGVSGGAQIVVDSSGNIDVVWDNFTSIITGGNSDIFFSRSSDGGATFSPPKNLSNNAGSSLFPGIGAATNRGNIAVDSSGNINVVWDDNTSGNFDIFFSRSSDGGATFSTPKNLSNDPSGSAESQIAVDSRGNINVIWIDNAPGNSDIFFSRSTDGGATFSTPKNVSKNAGSSGEPRIAMDAGGNINVVWDDDTPGNFDVFFSRSTDGGATFSTPKNLSNNPSASLFPQIAVDSRANIDVVWEEHATPSGNSLGILFSRSTDGGVTFSTPQNLSNNAFEPQIAVGPSGNINVIWDNVTFPPPKSDIFFTGAVAPVNSMDDNFNGNSLDPNRWSVLSPPPGSSVTVTATNQRLEVTMGPGAGGGGIVSVCSVAGDFDAQVDYILLNWPSNNSHSVRLGAFDLGVPRVGAVGMNRSSFSSELYIFQLLDQFPQTSTSDRAGKLRLVRTGSTLSGFFFSGAGWVLVGSGAVATGPTRFNLDLGTNDPSAPGGIMIAFDNFQVNAGTISCLPPSPQRVTGLSAVVGDSSVYLRWDPVPIKVDTFVVEITQQSGNTSTHLGTVACDPRNAVTVGTMVQQDPSCLITTLPDGSPILNGITYGFTVAAKSGGVLGVPSNPVFAAAGGFSGANKPPKPSQSHRLLFLHGFLGDGRVTGTFTDTLHFMTKTLGWTYGGQLYHIGDDVQVTGVDKSGSCEPDLFARSIFFGIRIFNHNCKKDTAVDKTGDFFTASFASRTADYSDRRGLSHQGDEVSGVVAKMVVDGVPAPFSIIAHSNGGLAARDFVTRFPGAPSRIFEVITYGSPHRGADVSDFDFQNLQFFLFPPYHADGARDARFVCSSPTTISYPAPFLQDLSGKRLPSNIGYTAAVGDIDMPVTTLFGILTLRPSYRIADCHSADWDSLVPVSSADLSQAGGPVQGIQVRSLQTNHAHIGQGNDFPTILCAIDPNCAMFRVMSPVDIEVTAPDGRVIAHDLAAIPGASYMNIKDSTGHETATVPIPFPLGGDYTIKAVPKPGVSPTDTYTLEVVRAGVTTIVALNQRVQDIPSQPYVVTVLPPMPIDIKPGGFPNSINLRSSGTIPVAILSTTAFNAPSRVEKTSLTFGRTGSEQSLAFCNSGGEDVNVDGLLDLVCHFRTQQTHFVVGDSQGEIKGRTVDGVPFVGTDSVRIVK